MNKKNKFCLKASDIPFLIIGFILGGFFVNVILPKIVDFFNNSNIENFANDERLSPASFPSSVDTGILKNFYKWKDPDRVSDLDYASQSKIFPIFPSNSRKINNIEFWPLPINGTCSFPELCGNMYKKFPCKEQEERLARWQVNGKPVRIWPPCDNKRVNFWCAKP